MQLRTKPGDTSAAASGNVVGLDHINGVDVVAHESTGSQEGYPAYIGAPTLNVRIRRGYVSNHRNARRIRTRF